MAGTGRENSQENYSDESLRDRLDDITRLVSDWVWETDKDLNLTYVSDRVFEVLGYHPYEIIGQNITNIVEPISNKDGEIGINQRTPFREAMMTTVTKSGENRFVRVSSIPKYDNDTGIFSGIRGTAKDVTDEENTKRDLIIALAQTEIASRAKSDFLSSMSHELRTPMNAILGFTQFILNNPREKLTPTQQDYAKDILKSGQHLMQLIDQVLDLSQIETGHHHFNFNAVSPNAVAKDCLRMVAERAESQAITIENLIPEQDLQSLWTDESKFRQVLLNLLSNAVKYNRSGGRVILSAEQTSAHYMRIIIQDTGVGISQDKQDSLFEPFNRLGREASEIEGTGIGLTITKHVVELLDGHIGFVSEEGVGSTFWFELPIANETTDHEFTI